MYFAVQHWQYGMWVIRTERRKCSHSINSAMWRNMCPIVPSRNEVWHNALELLWLQQRSKIVFTIPGCCPVSVHRWDISQCLWNKRTCYSLYVFINPCKALSVQPRTSPTPTHSQSLLHPSQGIKYHSVVAINIHPGSSISSQFWFSLLFVIRPRALCGVSPCILAEKTLREDLWFGKPELERTTVYWSQQLAPLRSDTCPTLWQSLQTGCSLDMCTAEASAREPGAEKPAQQPERPVEATEYPLEEDRSSLEPPGQEA